MSEQTSNLSISEMEKKALQQIYAKGIEQKIDREEIATALLTAKMTSLSIIVLICDMLFKDRIPKLVSADLQNLGVTSESEELSLKEFRNKLPDYWNKMIEEIRKVQDGL